MIRLLACSYWGAAFQGRRCQVLLRAPSTMRHAGAAGRAGMQRVRGRRSELIEPMSEKKRHCMHKYDRCGQQTMPPQAARRTGPTHESCAALVRAKCSRADSGNIKHTANLQRNMGNNWKTKACTSLANAAAGAAAAAPAHIENSMATIRDAMVGFMSQAPARAACVSNGRHSNTTKQ